MSADIPPAERVEKEVLAAIGAIVLTWADAEAALAIAVAIVARSEGVMKGHKEYPLQLARRVDYLNRAASTVKQLEAHKDAIKMLTGAFTVLGKLRHDLVHGAAAEIDIAGAVETHRIAVEQGKQILLITRFEPGSLLTLYNDIDRLYRGTVGMLPKIEAAFG